MRAVCPLALLLAFAPALADDVEPKQAKLTREQLEKAETAVKKLVEETKAQNAKLTRLADVHVEKAVPSTALYSLTFRQFPVARPLPKGYKAANLVTVAKDMKPKVINTQKELQTFFESHLPACTSDAKCKEAARAVALAAAELHQDGYYTFQLEDDSTKVEGDKEKTSKAKVGVKEGGTGYLEVALKFDKAGKLVSVEETDKIKRGIRPICQATKLLDKDPVVRAMAEQCIIVMGRAAKDYLDEQKAKASPELKKEIERVWKKILESDD